MKKAFFFFSLFLFFSNFSTAKDSARFSLGAGIFNYMEDGTPPHNIQSTMINFEIHSGRKNVQSHKTFCRIFRYYRKCLLCLRRFWNRWLLWEKKNFVVTPSLACGYYKDGHEIKAGNPLEFYIGIDIFYRFKNNVRFGVGIFHISNADSGYRNPGSETLTVKYQIPFGK